MLRTNSFLGEERFAELREVRASAPETIAARLAAREKRQQLTNNGKLFIVAADHTARGALGVGSNPTAMADRYELLDRLALALSRPGVDGVLGTPDIIDDLALLGVLDNKVVVASMNRGGIRGSSFEFDDRFGAYSVDSIVRDRLDFAKTLLRINLSDPATAATLHANAQAVTEAARAQLPIMLEPFLSEWRNGVATNLLDADSVIASVAIASGLGDTSAYTWMKLPVVAEMERVMAATTLPTLLLGGDPSGGPEENYRVWENALALPGVRGLVVGRTMLYPPDGDVVAAVDTAAALVAASASS